MVMNFFILCLHITVICGMTLAALRTGLEMMIAWLCLLSVAMNLFVLKQITLFGLSVTASDALAVGYLLGLNLIQEFFGRSLARKCMWISLFISCGFLFLSQIHLLYMPNQFDLVHSHSVVLFRPMPRIILASLVSFLTVQIFDLAFFGFLKKKMEGKYLLARTASALFLSQTLDTCLFSYLALYGSVASVSHVIYVSIAMKGLVILLSTPFVALAKQIMKKSYVQV
jgi:queuosine precursor transporter